MSTATKTEPTPAATDQATRISPVRQVLNFVGVQNMSLIIALVLLILIIGVQNPNFFNLQNVLGIGTAITVFGILAVMQTVVVLLGALDISVGSVTGLTSVLSAMVFTATTSSALGVLAALLIGGICGLVNGLIIVYGRVNPVIATLATLAAFQGVAQIVSDGRSQGYTGSDALFTTLGTGTLLGIPVLIYIFVILALIVHLILKYSVFGRNIYAIGGNDTASRLAGVNLNRYVVVVYIAVGVVAGIAGVLLTARTGSGQPVSGSEGLELESITAAALGGAALQGGKGSIVGTVLAVILLGVLTNGLTVLGVNPFWQNVAKGALLVIAVIIQQRRSGQRTIGIPT